MDNITDKVCLCTANGWFISMIGGNCLMYITKSIMEKRVPNLRILHQNDYVKSYGLSLQ